MDISVAEQCNVKQKEHPTFNQVPLMNQELHHHRSRNYNHRLIWTWELKGESYFRPEWYLTRKTRLCCIVLLDAQPDEQSQCQKAQFQWQSEKSQ